MSEHGTAQPDRKPKTDKTWGLGRGFSLVIAPCILISIVMVFFGDVLFFSGQRVLSKEGTDLFSQFLPIREFGFNELRKGNLALWNPYIFSGTPFFAGFQPALLYPLNLIYLFLPLAKAINVGIALHVFLAGLSMYFWTAYRGLHPCASLFSAILFMFCGPFFLHIYPGHLSNLSGMVWAPLVFLAVDGLVDRGSFGWCLFGMFVVTMQLLAGHPQYVFYTGVAGMIYAGLLMVNHPKRIKIGLGFLGIYGGAAALSAVQLIPGIQAASESVRGTGLPYEFAAMFSLPPENLIGLLSPGFFGDAESVQYWGRCNFWEMSLFISVTGLALSIVGATSGERSVRRFSVIMVAVLLVLALGSHTPLFRILYHFVPGFNKFRGSSKFMFFVSVYLIMLAGIGFDALLRKGRGHRRVILFSFMMALILAVLAIAIWHSAVHGGPKGFWARALWAVQETGESYLPKETYLSQAFIRDSGLFASRGLLISSGTCILLASIFFIMRSWRKAVYLLALLAIGEILYFAKGFRPTSDLQFTRVPQIIQLASKNKKNDRILNVVNANSTMSEKIGNIWGNDPGVLRRYAQFMTYSQGGNPDKAIHYVHFSRPHRWYKMLRCRYIVGYSNGETRILEFKDTLPVAILIDQYRLVPDKDRIFEEMENPAFDPRKTVMLETAPDPEPVKSKDKGFVKITNASTDHLIVEAELSSPKILLITDAFSRGWRVRPLTKGAQESYQVMPANYILRAIPLKSGQHRFVLEYSPLAFRVGKWISLCSVGVYMVLIAWYFLRRSHRRTLPHQ